MTSLRRDAALGAVLLLGVGVEALAQTSIANTVRDLSAGGPGAVHAVPESRVSISCHAPIIRAE